MSEKDKEKEVKKVEEEELNLEDLDKVTGGSLRNVAKKSTSSISKSTRKNI